ncbi:MAG: monofunctional biosynthetic peptidoglycan transglycosylase [Flavobacteriales bacterium]|nr:monofunctional biosynthetic peptidoglycan transglycosylase [Flavobacteriales bacterium]
MKEFLKKAAKIIFKIAICFVVASIVWVILYRFVNPPVTYLMISKWANQGYGIEKEWKNLNEISPYLQLGVICAEDQNFVRHYGLDFGAIEKAQEHNKKSKRKRGASTISQQVAKNVFLWPGRSWIRKGFEVYFTLLIELIWNKKRILEMYLNVAEMGKGIYGAEAAARHHFKKSAKKLSKHEAALIVVCIPNPVKFNASRPSSYIYSRQAWLINQMRLFGGVKYLEKLDGEKLKEETKKKK